MRFWRTIDRIEGGMASVGAGLCLLAMVLITVISVFGRYVLQQDILPGAYNLVERICFPLIVFWAMPMAHREGIFPRFDMVVDALPTSWRRFVTAAVLVVELVVYMVVMWYVLRFAWNSIDIGRTMQIGTDFWPVWPIVVMMPLAFGLMMLEMLRLIWRDIRNGGSDGPPRETDNVSAAF